MRLFGYAIFCSIFSMTTLWGGKSSAGTEQDKTANFTPSQKNAYRSANKRRILGKVMISAGTPVGATLFFFGAFATAYSGSCAPNQPDEKSCRKRVDEKKLNGQIISAVGAATFVTGLGGGLYLNITGNRDMRKIEEQAGNQKDAGMKYERLPLRSESNLRLNASFIPAQEPSSNHWNSPGKSIHIPWQGVGARVALVASF